MSIALSFQSVLGRQGRCYTSCMSFVNIRKLTEQKRTHLRTYLTYPVELILSKWLGTVTVW